MGQRILKNELVKDVNNPSASTLHKNSTNLTMDDGIPNPFYLLGSQPEAAPEEGEPNGEMDLAAHFEIKTIHGAVVAKQPTSYLRNAPEFLNKGKMYKGDSMCLRTVMLQAPASMKIEQFDKDYLKKQLLLTTGTTELSDEDMGTLVEGEGWGQSKIAPSSRETSQGKADVKGGIARTHHTQAQAVGLAQQEQQKEASTKIRFRIGGGPKEKNRKGKKNKREKKDKDREKKRAKKDKQE